jgi:hypothetical protein
MTKTTTPDRKPTEQQAMLIKMASRKAGATRADVREALGYADDANIPVQSMLKNIAIRFGYRFNTSYSTGETGRAVAAYHFEKPAVAAKKTAKAPKRRAAAA